MDELFVDWKRLECLAQQELGVEAFSTVARVSDFLRYYFTRFTHNLVHLNSSFSRSELAAYQARYARQLEQTFVDTKLDLSTLIVAIPQGMHGSYSEIVSLFETLLDEIGTDTLVVDITNLPTYSNNTDVRGLKSSLEHAFSPHGLLISPASVVLKSLSETAGTYSKLLQMTRRYYPIVLAIPALLSRLEKNHAVSKQDGSVSSELNQTLLHLAGRLTMFGAVMTKLQMTEHAFVRALETLRKHASRT